MKTINKISLIDLTDELKDKDLLMIKGGTRHSDNEVNACHSGSCTINIGQQ